MCIHICSGVSSAVSGCVSKHRHVQISHDLHAVKPFSCVQAWLTGDVISCTLDLDQGLVEFFRFVIALDTKSCCLCFELLTDGSGQQHLKHPQGTLPFLYWQSKSKESLTSEDFSTARHFEIQWGKMCIADGGCEIEQLFVTDIYMPFGDGGSVCVCVCVCVYM